MESCGSDSNQSLALSFKEKGNSLKRTASSVTLSNLDALQISKNIARCIFGSSFSIPQNTDELCSMVIMEGLISKLLAAIAARQIIKGVAIGMANSLIALLASSAIDEGVGKIQCT
ncbi:hypothetical protein L3X38_006847 [Prunus dulcis]|uniref:Uncharacterized protein n=1 Tax=Prunus dulcis TaxID=3755 RepID=A0AAD4ZTF7_PRUDU|nr:hypothetical protein L3X38_006847 [Prunus dulcis]